MVHAWVLGGADLGWLAGLARVGRLAAAGERLVGSVWPWWAWSQLSDIARCMMNLGTGLAVFQLCARQRSFLLDIISNDPLMRASAQVDALWQTPSGRLRLKKSSN